MTFIANILPYVQIVLSVILIMSVLMQKAGSDTGGIFGGSDGNVFYSTRRGFDKFLFITTIVSGILFAVSAFLAMLVR